MPKPDINTRTCTLCREPFLVEISDPQVQTEFCPECSVIAKQEGLGALADDSSDDTDDLDVEDEDEDEDEEDEYDEYDDEDEDDEDENDEDDNIRDGERHARLDKNGFEEKSEAEEEEDED